MDPKHPGNQKIRWQTFRFVTVSQKSWVPPHSVLEPLNLPWSPVESRWVEKSESSSFRIFIGAS